jgi:hypothetical protein
LLKVKTGSSHFIRIELGLAVRADEMSNLPFNNGQQAVSHI